MHRGCTAQNSMRNACEMDRTGPFEVNQEQEEAFRSVWGRKRLRERHASMLWGKEARCTSQDLSKAINRDSNRIRFQEAIIEQMHTVLYNYKTIVFY